MEKKGKTWRKTPNEDWLSPPDTQGMIGQLTWEPEE